MSKKSKIFKAILMVLVLIIIISAIIYMFPIVKNLSTTEGQIEFKEKIGNMGILGMLALFGLQLAQIFLVIIPGEPIEVLAGICYGALGGFIFISISVAIITSLIIFLVRKLGRKFVYDFYSEEKIKKIEQNKFLKNPKKIEIIMMLLFFIPGTPKDLLVYIAALLPIKPVRFIIISTIARFPSIITSTLAGEHLADGNWEMTIMIYGITLLIIGITIMIINIFDKNKITKDVINSLNSKEEKKAKNQ